MMVIQRAFAENVDNAGDNTSGSEDPSREKQGENTWPKREPKSQSSKSGVMPGDREGRTPSRIPEEVQMPDLCERPNPPDWCFDD